MGLLRYFYMIKHAIHQAAWRGEKFFDRLRGPRTGGQVIEPYIGYATPDHLVVRGRVLSHLRRNKVRPDQSRWENFKQMVSLFLTNEVASVEVTARGVTALSDEEGYFTLLLPRSNEAGWINVDVCIADQSEFARCPVLVPDANAQFGVISDIDDTMLRTGAYSLLRNLWTSLTGNVATREVFPAAKKFMDALSDNGQNPVYYVSSSPWNLHHFLNQIFDRAGLVRGPMFLRDLGLSKTQFITGTHGDHKGASIDTLIAAHPDLPFVLVGDTGQHDAFVYHDVIERHPGRIAAVVLHEPGPGPDDESRKVMEAIGRTSTLLLHAPSFEGFAEQVLNAVSPAD